MLNIFAVLFGLLLHEAFGEHVFHLCKMPFSIVNTNNNLESNDQ
jgi:hypothetical protein